MIEAERWRDELGLTEAQIVAEAQRVVAAKRDGAPKSLSYLRGAMERLAGQLSAARSVDLRPAATQGAPPGSTALAPPPRIRPRPPKDDP